MFYIEDQVRVKCQMKFQKEEELQSIIKDGEIKISLLIEDMVVGIVMEEEAIIFNKDQPILEEVNQKDLQITIINLEEAKT